MKLNHLKRFRRNNKLMMEGSTLIEKESQSIKVQQISVAKIFAQVVLKTFIKALLVNLSQSFQTNKMLKKSQSSRSKQKKRKYKTYRSLLQIQDSLISNLAVKRLGVISKIVNQLKIIQDLLYLLLHFPKMIMVSVMSYASRDQADVAHSFQQIALKIVKKMKASLSKSNLQMLLKIKFREECPDSH